MRIPVTKADAVLAPLDRAALERVLARAAELQTQTGGGDTAETAAALTDDQILELGREVGISPDALRQAIAEERGRVGPPEARGLVGAWFGAAAISAARVVPGSPERVLKALDAVLREELTFTVRRRFPNRLLWEPRRGFFDVVRIQLGRATEGAGVREAQEVSAFATAVDADRTHVRLDAALVDKRATAAILSVVSVGSAGALAYVAAVALVNPVVSAAVLGVAATGMVLGARRSYQRTASRVATALEQLLDRLEFGPAQRRSSVIEKLLR
jgi:hypothetical protein